MTRVTTTILIVMLLMNGTIGIMSASGLSDDLGVQFAPGVSETMDEAVDTAKEGFSADSGIADTLFALFISGVKTISAIVQAIFSAPGFFTNLGFPEWFVVPLFAPVYVISTFEMISIATGRRTL